MFMPPAPDPEKSTPAPIPGGGETQVSMADLTAMPPVDTGGRIPVKNTPADVAVRDNSYSVTADELRQFIERFEHLAAEKQDIAEQQKDVMAEAKARGYDTKVMKIIIAMRKRDRDDLAEEEATLDLYMAALGMA
ncbi:DUF2312 domain-containing protein [Paenirhodobacter hankyongi]|nr:DUF2312 domain-containing protein [Sinirhodobacter hankyongi]